MPSEANDSPTTTPPVLLRAADALDSLANGLDALMFLCVSEHFNDTEQAALGFIHTALSDKCAEAKRLVEDARSLKLA